jgi:hypothetical protein
MDNKGKTAAIKVLRREVGFGCPICRSPFLTWHHFDPPWDVEKHWRPEGIIAMCPICHADADKKGESAGAYSKGELRALKESNRSNQDVKGYFPTWQDKESLLVRVGGCYTDTSAPVILINDIPQITVGKNEAGILSLSFELRNKNDDILVKMEENWFDAYPSNIHDMIIEPKTKKVKVWLTQEDIGLDLSFRRVTMAELEKLLESDYKSGYGRMQEWLSQLPLEQRKIMAEQKREIDELIRESEPPSWIEKLPPEIRDIHLAEDKTGFFVKRWVKDNCVMDDGLIPLLNFEQMAIYFHGEKIIIKDGVANFLHYCCSFKSKKGHINLPCKCSYCSPSL